MNFLELALPPNRPKFSFRSLAKASYLIEGEFFSKFTPILRS